SQTEDVEKQRPKTTRAGSAPLTGFDPLSQGGFSSFGGRNTPITGRSMSFSDLFDPMHQSQAPKDSAAAIHQNSVSLDLSCSVGGRSECVFRSR
ncbi:hypothetical protein KIPB_014410, partial [Kipferlia bialata]